jgi:Protein of unknown function (DUF2911)
MRTFLTLTALALAPTAATARAQLELPQLSPAASVKQVVGTATITVDYHRPAVRGRVIWGELVPYDEVWRTGANEATAIRFDSPVTIGGHEVPAGRYGLFTIPGRETWTFVLNSVDDQWGAYQYDAAKDVLRVDVKPRAAPHREWMSIEVEPTGPGSAELRVTWEKLQVALPIEVDVHAIVQQRIREALARAKPGDAQLYLQAARYYYDNKLDLVQALEWVNQSVAAQQSPRNLELLARLLHDTGDTAEAIPPLQRAIELARGSAPAEYVEGLEKVLAEWQTAR